MSTLFSGLTVTVAVLEGYVHDQARVKKLVVNALHWCVCICIKARYDLSQPPNSPPHSILPARVKLSDPGTSEVVGGHIKFWLDSVVIIQPERWW